MNRIYPAIRLFSFFLYPVVLMPLVLYVKTFGWNISSDHTRWGEFGSAISGIYTPLLTILTLSVLVIQVKLQSKMHVHDQDKAYLEQSRTDIEFYVIRLETVLQLRLSDGNTVRDILEGYFITKSIDDLDSPKLRELSLRLNYEAPQLLGMFQAIQAMLIGLDTPKSYSYQLYHSSAIQKLIALLSFRTCVALENYHRTVTEGRTKTKYFFSSFLTV